MYWIWRWYFYNRAKRGLTCRTWENLIILFSFSGLWVEIDQRGANSAGIERPMFTLLKILWERV